MDYTFELAGEAQAELLHAMMAEVSKGMEDPSLYILNSLEDVREHMRSGSFAVLARDEKGNPAGCLLCYVPLNAHENLGAEAFPQTVIYILDTAVVLKAHRGNHLQEKMIRFTEQQIPKSGNCCLMATVSPYNEPSLRSLLKAGYRILETKEKYGGHLRHIVYKEWKEE